MEKIYRTGRSRRASSLAVFLLILATASAGIAAQQGSIEGIWEGRIERPQKLRIVLHVTTKPATGLGVTLDVPEWGRWDWPASNTSLSGNAFAFDVPSWSGFRFAGMLDQERKTLTGTVRWSDGVSRAATLKYQGPETALVPPSEIDGDWFGLLRSPTYRSLRLGLHIRTNRADKMNVAFDDIDRANMAVPCENAKFDSHAFSFEISAWHAKYSARLSPDNKTLDGFWDQWRTLPLTFVRQTNQAAELSARLPIPAIAPVPLDNLKPILDREFAPMLNHGLLSETAGGGIVIGIVDHGRRRIFSYGAAKPDSIFEIGSITKTFTGLALAQMVEQGRVSLAEPVRELLPPGTIAKSGSEITLVDLATHRSGLPRLPDNLDPDPNAYSGYNIDKLREFFEKHPALKQADTKFQYSNFGFGVLGYALARRAGCSYEQLIKDDVTGPIKLQDTVVSLSPEQKKRLIQGYNSALDPVESGDWDYPFFEGAASLKSTAADMLSYLYANMHPATVDSGGLAGSPGATLAKAMILDHQRRADVGEQAKVALAWFFNEKLRYFCHGGGTTGYSSWAQFSPEKDRALVVLSNRLDNTPGEESLVGRVAANIDTLMSGRQSRRIDQYPESDDGLVAAHIRK
ncbi:MAG: serine hydrolase domain-containing protein [Candidatus Binataceae bacterium]